MSVYVETVILDNAVMDAVLLYLAVRLSGGKIRVWRIAVGAAIGTAFAVITPFISLSGALSLALKLSVGGLMVAVAAGHKRLRRYALSLAYFLLLTFGSGGALLAIGYLINGSFCAKKGTFLFFPAQNVPVAAIIFGGSAAAVLFFKLIFGARKRANLKPFKRTVALFDGAESVYLDGFIDTGNTLYDGVTLKPVCLIGKSVADSLKRRGVIACRGQRYLRCATATGEGKIAVFEIDRLVIYSGEERHIIDNAIMGVSPSDLVGTDVIVHSALVMGEQ